MSHPTMQKVKLLEQIRDFADQAHGDQMRKYANDRYIVHPERVMKTCQEYSDKLPIAAAALLHDVLEDTDVSAGEIEAFLSLQMSPEESKTTLKLVKELTDVYTKEAYPSLNRDRRKQKELERFEKTSPDTQTIKYADIIDNCKEIVRHDSSFAPKFLKECLSILKTARRRNKELHKVAMETLLEEQKKIGRKKYK